MSEGVRHTQAAVRLGTSARHARLDQALHHRVRRIQVGIRSSPTTARRQRRPPSMRILIQILLRTRTKLRDLRPRTSRDCTRTGGVAALPRRIRTPCHCLHRPQESVLLPRTPQVEPTTSTMGPLSVAIRPTASPCTGTANGSVRCPLSTCRPMSCQRPR